VGPTNQAACPSCRWPALLAVLTADGYPPVWLFPAPTRSAAYRSDAGHCRSACSICWRWICCPVRPKAAHPEEAQADPVKKARRVRAKGR
jgi:hypothetical protein